ncbi:MAG: DUF4125 family protein [Mailhella sp.]|nr:DUF4125 family protein [Mailhella sp.]
MAKMTEEQLLAAICDLEWEMFDQVNNNGGRASCQNDPVFFKKMRACQFAGWDAALLESYFMDLQEAKLHGRNPLAEKYGYMMESTFPAEYENIKDQLPPVSPEKAEMIAKIVEIQLTWEGDVDRRYPGMRAGGRPLTSDRDTPMVTSFQTYLTGALKTYSERTLVCMLECIGNHLENGTSLAQLAAEQTALAYGYPSIDALEQAALARRAR